MKQNDLFDMCACVCIRTQPENDKLQGQPMNVAIMLREDQIETRN